MAKLVLAAALCGLTTCLTAQNSLGTAEAIEQGVFITDPFLPTQAISEYSGALYSGFGVGEQNAGDDGSTSRLTGVRVALQDGDPSTTAETVNVYAFGEDPLTPGLPNNGARVGVTGLPGLAGLSAGIVSYSFATPIDVNTRVRAPMGDRSVTNLYVSVETDPPVQSGMVFDGLFVAFLPFQPDTPRTIQVWDVPNAQAVSDQFFAYFTTDDTNTNLTVWSRGPLSTQPWLGCYWMDPIADQPGLVSASTSTQTNYVFGNANAFGSTSQGSGAHPDLDRLGPGAGDSPVVLISAEDGGNGGNRPFLILFGISLLSEGIPAGLLVPTFEGILRLPGGFASAVVMTDQDGFAFFELAPFIDPVARAAAPGLDLVYQAIDITNLRLTNAAVCKLNN